MSGICDPKDGQCYKADVSFKGASDQMQTAINAFSTQYSLAGLNDSFPISDMDVMVLGAKMSLLQINLYQQKIMLGSSAGDNTTMMSVANKAAIWLQVRAGVLS